MASPHIEIPGYRIEKRMAYGAQGEVFLATQVSLNRSVALKVVHHDPNNAAEIERLRREGELLARLDSRHVVKVHDYGTLDGFSYLAMELLDGENLDQYLQRLHGNGRGSAGGAGSIAGRRTEARGAPVDETVVIPDRSRPANGANAAHDPTRAVAATETATRSRRRAPLAPEAFRSNEHIRRTIDIGLDVCQGLIDLHGQNLLHRDLKPANIMLTPEGRAVITDLGLAKAPDLPRLSLTGQILGTPSYMSPEVADGRHPSARTDVYGLGTTLYHGLTGSPPFEGQSISKMMTSLVRGETEPIARLNPAVPKSLAEVVEMAIAPDPRDRHADAAAFHAALQTVRDGQRFASKWTFGRYYRRQRRWCRPAAVVLVLLLVLLVLQRLSSAPRTELDILRDLVVSDQHEAAHVKLESTPKTERQQLLDQLEANVTGHDARQIMSFLAAEREMALLGVPPMSGWSVTLVEADLLAPEARRLPKLAEFRSLDDGAQLLMVRAGYVRILLVAPSTESWPDGAPLVYEQLLALTAQARGDDVEMLRFDPPNSKLARQSLRDDGKPLFVPFERPDVRGRQRFAVAHNPSLWLAVDRYLEWVGTDPIRALLFKHPGEPDGMLDLLRDRLRGGQPQPPPMQPAIVDYWVAFRVAGYLGCRLPDELEVECAVQTDTVNRTAGLREWTDSLLASGKLDRRLAPFAPGLLRPSLHDVCSVDALRVGLAGTVVAKGDLSEVGFRVYRSAFD